MTVREALKGFKTISLHDVEKEKLMDRVDTKYVVSTPSLLSFLDGARDRYAALSIDGETVMAYSSRYFDTEENRMYLDHQRGKRTRQKIRIRLYAANGDAFIEIKSKSNRGATSKRRLPMKPGETLEDYTLFIEENSFYKTADLHETLRVSFDRITLMDAGQRERITVDINLEFHNPTTGLSLALGDVAVIEWKRSGAAADSPLKTLLRDLRIKPRGFSKYCIGMAMTDPSLRQNRLKEKIRALRQ